MVFHFDSEEVSEKERLLMERQLAASGSPLAAKERLTVHPRDGFILFEFEDGFSFYRADWTGQSHTDMFQCYLRNPAIHRYMPVTYEIIVADAETTAHGLLNNFREKYGRTADHIDWMHTTIPNSSTSVIMMLLPQEIVEAMMRPRGGTLYTEITGPAGALRALPSVAPLIPDTISDDEHVRRLFATQYEATQYDQALLYHHQVVREVFANHGKGISLRKVAAWNP